MRNPGMAWRLAMAAESKPYCILAIATTAHINRHFLFAHKDVSAKWADSDEEDIFSMR